MTSSLSGMRSNQLSYEPLQRRHYRQFSCPSSGIGRPAPRDPRVPGQPRTSSRDRARGRPLVHRQLRDATTAPGAVKPGTAKNGAGTAHGAPVALRLQIPPSRRSAHLPFSHRRRARPPAGGTRSAACSTLRSFAAAPLRPVPPPQRLKPRWNHHSRRHRRVTPAPKDHRQGWARSRARRT
jgi:hypothetical protein